MKLRWVQQREFTSYLEDDWVAQRIRDSEIGPGATDFTDNWLLESSPKRFLYHMMYGDLLNKNLHISIAEIGPGNGSTASWVAEGRKWLPIDTDPNFEEKCGINGDWGENWRDIESCQMVLANDVFPNVDQRVGMLFKLFLESSMTKLRISLTFFSDVKTYAAKRLDGDEVLTVKAMQTHEAKSVLLENFPGYANIIHAAFSDVPSSIFPNGRLVLVVDFARKN